MDGLWLGATDVGHEGTFIWQSSGKPLSFTNWFYLNPNNWGGNENCLQQNFVDFKWNDVQCDQSGQITMCEMLFPCS